MEERREAWTDRPETWLGGLFLLVALGTRGFHAIPDTIGALDERLYHLPTVREFAKTWPAADFRGYQAATGPTYHYLLAPFAKLSGGDVALLRTITGLLSMATAWLVAALLRRFVGWRGPDATAGAVLFAIAPYTLGSAFVLGTDNPALLFTFAAMYGLLSYRERPAVLTAAGTGLAIALALTTRQTSVWLVPAGWAIVLRDPAPWPTRLGAAGLIGLGAVPLLLLTQLWGGPVPPAFQGVNLTPSSLQLTEVTLALGLIGLYGGILEPRTSPRRSWTTLRSPWAALVVFALALLWAWGRIDATRIGESAPVDGMLIELASLTPPILGLCYVRSGIHLQRYCDGLVVLAVLAAVRLEEKPLVRKPGYWLLAALFIMFALLKATLFAGGGGP